MSKVTLPTETKIKVFEQLIKDRYQLLPDCYAVADRLKLYLEKAGDMAIQNRFYNGWTHDHYIGNVFIFSPNGVIIGGTTNAPGQYRLKNLRLR